MSTLLQEHLQKCCQIDLTLEPLIAQWTFDKRLAAKALQNVVQLFPHYSRHDESHSIQILTNIERVLGTDRINKLSATDTWLLLESAYHHDIGMVVSHEQQASDWQSEEFKSFLQKKSNGTQGEEKKIVDSILRAKHPRDFKIDDCHPLLVVMHTGYILADFYRAKHAGRAATIIDNPVESIGLNSPRTELIPKRLFSLLGDICQLHGKGREDLMNVPKIASGLGRDKAHPRFISCLLRMGDLLDLDDNRFCPVMLKIAGNLPASTLAHIDKHHSIRHFRVDPERIEAHAICSTYEGYVEAESWFDYLREEIAWQMAHWADIVPDSSFGLLPTIGNIETELQGHELIDNRDRPHFQLDPEKVVEILQGAGLYKSPQEALRELIQNAIDATLMHIWLKHGDHIDAEKALLHVDRIHSLDSPFDAKIQNIFEQHPLHIQIVETKNENNEEILHLKIRDSGTGISRNDLRSMCKIGGSHKNEWKQEIIRTMPVWLRPSGAFGIGLQSAFLLTKELTYHTKSATTGESLTIRLSDPAGPEKGAIYIKKNQNSTGSLPGTITELKIAKRKLQNFPMFFARYVDPMEPQETNYLSGILENLPLPTYLNNVLIPKPNLDSQNWAYDHIAQVGIMADYSQTNQAGTYLTFKGQRVSSAGTGFTSGVLARVYINMYGNAEEMLSINRERIKASSVRTKIREATIRKITDDYNKSSSKADRAITSALLLHLKAPQGQEYLECNWEEKNQRTYSREFCFKPNLYPHQVTVADIVKAGTVFFHLFGDSAARTVTSDGKSYSSTDENPTMLEHVAERLGLKPKITEVNDRGAFFQYSKDVPNDKEHIPSLIAANLKNELRILVPLSDEYLILSTKQKIQWDPHLRSIRMEFREYTYSPFVMKNDLITTNRFEELISWTYTNRCRDEITLEQIRLAYHKLIHFVDAALSENKEWKQKKNFDLPALPQ